MFFISIIRTIKFALQNFWRNIWLSLVTIIILLLTLIFVSVLSALNLLGDQAIKSVQDKVDIDVFFITDSTSDQLATAKGIIESYPEVKDVTYITTDQALENFKVAHADDEQILASLDELEENPLPASFVIKAKKLNQYDAIIQRLDGESFKELILSRDFQDNAVLINRISQITTRLTQVGIGVSILFAVISFLVVFNTMRIAIYTHREEVGIMRLVGATNWFIRGPFMWESLLYAVLASVLTMALLYPAALVASPYVNAFFEGYTFDFVLFIQSNFWQIFLVQMAVSLGLSMLSSMVAITRYLKV